MARINDHGEAVWVLPAALNLSKVLQEHPPKGFKTHLDHFYHIFDHLSQQLEFQDLDETNGFINVNAEILRSYNKQSAKYLKYLVRRRIIYTDNHFILGKKSRGYAIAPEYLSEETMEIPIQKFTLRKRIKKYLKALEEKSKANEKSHGYLKKFYNKDLTIDVDAAMDTINKLFPEVSSRGWKTKEEIKLANKRHKAIQAVQRFARKDFTHLVDPNVGRFHTNITNIKKELRQHIRYKGKKLKNVDIVNSQPLLSSIILKPDFYYGTSTISIDKIPTVESLFYSIDNIWKCITDIAIYITLLLSSESQDRSSFEQYQRIVQDGSFYPVASSMMFPNEEYDKKKVKEAIFQTFFSSNRFIGQKDALPKKQFSLAYPGVYEVFKRLKRDDQAILSHLLQRIESMIMIETVCRRIANERPDLPIFPIHDSIATIEGEEQYVKQVMQEEIIRLTGLQATLNIED